MQHEELYLTDIVSAADAMARFIAGMTEGVFVASDIVRSAVMYKLIVIGEAAASLPDSFRVRHPQVPWVDVAAFRNKAVHHCFGTDWRTVWEVAVRDVPSLRALVVDILAAEFPSSASSSGPG